MGLFGRSVDGDEIKKMSRHKFELKMFMIVESGTGMG